MRRRKMKKFADRQTKNRQRTENSSKTEATLILCGSAGELSTLHYSHSTVGDAVHYLISMVMKYCTESIISYTVLYYNKICYYKMQFMTDSTVQY